MVAELSKHLLQRIRVAGDRHRGRQLSGQEETVRLRERIEAEVCQGGLDVDRLLDECCRSGKGAQVRYLAPA